MSIQIRYENLRAETMPDEVLTACSELFSSSYGTYDPKSPNRPGERIRMGVGQYRKRYCKKGFFLARALDGDKQVAHAIYIRKRYEPYGMITWVVQLVVDSEYRRKGIASTLLRSIWGLSDDFAWGLASANPCTVKTLESATFRRCDAAFVQKNIDAVRAIGADTGFVSDDAYDVGKNRSMVNTHFYADNSEYKEDVDCSRYLGDLPLGYEWLAFTFREQSISRDAFSRHFTRMMNGYDNILRDAYSRMNMSEHPWTKGTDAEVTFIVCPGSDPKGITESVGS